MAIYSCAKSVNGTLYFEVEADSLDQARELFSEMDHEDASHVDLDTQDVHVTKD